MENHSGRRACPRQRRQWFRGTAAVIIPFTLLFAACATREKKVVAEVDDRKITVADMVLQYRIMSVTVRPFVDTLEGKRGFVNDLINKEILLIEAKARGLDKAPEVQEALRRFEDQLLAQKSYITNVRDKVKVTEEDLRRLYQEDSEEARLRVLLTDTREKATEAKSLLGGGADFATLARERSLDAATRNRGGDMGFHTWSFYPEEIKQAARALQPGQTSEVVEGPSGFSLVRLEDLRPTSQGDFESERENLMDRVRKIQESRLAREWSATKRAEAAIQVVPETVSFLSERMREAMTSYMQFRTQVSLKVSDEDRNRPLATFAGRSWTLDDYLARLSDVPPEGRPKPTATPSEITEFITNLAVRELAVEEARRMGLQNDPEIVARMDRRRARVLAARAHDEIAKGEPIRDEDLEQYYQEHQASLIAPARARIRQAMFSTEEEARSWLQKIRQGDTSIKEVAEQASIDRESAALGGESGWIARSAQPTVLEKAVFSTEMNRLGGPIRVEGGWVIFRVSEKEGETPMSLEEAKPTIRKRLAEEQRIRLFDEWLAEQREKRKIKINEEVLRSIDFGTVPRSESPDSVEEASAPTPPTAP